MELVSARDRVTEGIRLYVRYYGSCAYQNPRLNDDVDTAVTLG